MKAKNVTINIRCPLDRRRLFLRNAFSLTRPSTQNHELVSIRHAGRCCLMGLKTPLAPMIKLSADAPKPSFS